VARDGQQALDYPFREGDFAGREAPDLPALVLLDIGLPRLSGIEVLERLRADPRTASMPVVMLTSSAELAATVVALGVYWPAVHDPPDQ
jgi:CheY-like chemotaxis protein